VSRGAESLRRGDLVSSFYRPRRGSNNGGFLKESPGDGRTKRSTMG
jgi:hypothetical protein